MTDNAPVSPYSVYTAPHPLSAILSALALSNTAHNFSVSALQLFHSTALSTPVLIAYNTHQTTIETVAYTPTSHPNLNPTAYSTPTDPAPPHPAPHPALSAGHPRSLFRTPTPNPSISTPMANENAQMSSSSAGAAHTPTADSIASTVRPGGAPARVYMNEKIVPYLLEGMKTVTKEQPANPLRVLGEFLIQKSNEVEGQSGRAPE